MIKLIISGILGRMGKEIIKLSKEIDDVTIISGFDTKSEIGEIPVFSKVEELPLDFDAIIDFSSSQAALKMLEFSVGNVKPFVTGTTGFSEKEEEEFKKAANKIPVFKASNMSVGVNCLAGMLEKLPAILYKNSDIEIVETHHRLKKDSPSGTAKTLGKIVAETSGKNIFLYGRKGKEIKRENGEIGFHSIRGGTVVGTHTVYFLGDDESIEITHRAYSRRIFALGAISAVKWLMKKGPGFYSMKDLLS